MITLLARFKIKPGEEASFELVARELLSAVRDEPGCVSLACLRDSVGGGFVLIERYRDANALAVHRSSEHFKRLGPAFVRAVDGTVEVEEYEELEW